MSLFATTEESTTTRIFLAFATPNSLFSSFTRFPQDFLESVYDSIEKQEIKMKGQASLAKKDAPDPTIVCWMVS